MQKPLADLELALWKLYGNLFSADSEEVALNRAELTQACNNASLFPFILLSTVLPSTLFVIEPRAKMQLMRRLVTSTPRQQASSRKRREISSKG